MLPGYQVGSRSFFHLLLPVNCISVPEEEWDKLNAVECPVYSSFDLLCVNDVMLELMERL